jgi:hypothetical protein
MAPPPAPPLPPPAPSDLPQRLKRLYQLLLAGTQDPIPCDDAGMRLNDGTCLRYLRARKFDVDKAAESLSSTLRWRDRFGMKDLYRGLWQDTLKRENATGKLYVRGFTRDGSCVLYIKPKYENTWQHDGNLKHLVYSIERCIAAMEHHPKRQEKMTLLIDFDGYNILTFPPIQTCLDTISIVQTHYPERLQKAYCVRGPWILQGFWTTVMPFINPTTRQKIEMVSAQDMRARLTQDIAPSMLEVEVGGDDPRPFDSATYLQGAFHTDYYSLLEAQEKKTKKKAPGIIWG